MEKVAVYAEKYAICTLLGNTRIMPRSHIGIKPSCLVGWFVLVDQWVCWLCELCLHHVLVERKSTRQIVLRKWRNKKTANEMLVLPVANHKFIHQRKSIQIFSEIFHIRKFWKEVNTPYVLHACCVKCYKQCRANIVVTCCSTSVVTLYLCTGEKCRTGVV